MKINLKCRIVTKYKKTPSRLLKKAKKSFKEWDLKGKPVPSRHFRMLRKHYTQIMLTGLVCKYKNWDDTDLLDRFPDLLIKYKRREGGGK